MVAERVAIIRHVPDIRCPMSGSGGHSRFLELDPDTSFSGAVPRFDAGPLTPGFFGR